MKSQARGRWIRRSATQRVRSPIICFTCLGPCCLSVLHARCSSHGAEHYPHMSRNSPALDPPSPSHPLLTRPSLLFSAPSVPSSAYSFSHRIGQALEPARPSGSTRVGDILTPSMATLFLFRRGRRFGTALLIAPVLEAHEIPARSVLRRARQASAARPRRMCRMLRFANRSAVHNRRAQTSHVFTAGFAPPKTVSVHCGDESWLVAQTAVGVSGRGAGGSARMWETFDRRVNDMRPRVLSTGDARPLGGTLPRQPGPGSHRGPSGHRRRGAGDVRARAAHEHSSSSSVPVSPERRLRTYSTRRTLPATATFQPPSALGALSVLTAKLSAIWLARNVPCVCPSLRSPTPDLPYRENLASQLPRVSYSSCCSSAPIALPRRFGSFRRVQRESFARRCGPLCNV
ncbi:hypothetical protein C2E23DRAFT_173539 [Lenzites betulinus]|nr:hypothetical protein C2E23DRAFT_173539 [Lenzites betulinus]